MSYVARNRGWLALVAGFVLPLATAALLVPFRNSFSDAAGVVGVGGVGDLGGHGGDSGGRVYGFVVGRPVVRFLPDPPI